MDYRYLKAFLAVANHQNFSKAAEELKIAQSAVSRQIKLLEESIGQELIIRSSKKVLFTQKGNELFLALKNFDHQINDLMEKEEGRVLKIGSLHGLLEFWLLPHLASYSKKSKSSIEIHIADLEELHQGMESGRFDIIFSTENFQSELVSSLRLFTEELVLISKNEIDPKKIHNYPWVVYGKLDHLFHMCKDRPVATITVDSITAMISLVRLGSGIAVVPDHVLKKNDSLKVYPLSEKNKSTIYLTTLNYKKIPSNLKLFIDQVGRNLPL